MGVLHAALPMQYVNEKFLEVPENPPNEENYKDGKFLFATDYERENPAYSEAGKKKMLE